MVKKKVVYEDFDGNKREDEYLFNLSKADAMDLQVMYEGGFSDYVQKCIDKNDQKALMEVFKELVKRAYGVKSPDGKHFYKDEKIWEDFHSSAAYPELMYELATNETSASNFFNAVMPKLD